MTPTLYELGRVLRQSFGAVRFVGGRLEARTKFGWESAPATALGVVMLVNKRFGNRPGNCLLVTAAA